MINIKVNFILTNNILIIFYFYKSEIGKLVNIGYQTGIIRYQAYRRKVACILFLTVDLINDDVTNTDFMFLRF